MQKTDGGITKYVRNKFWGISIEKFGFFFKNPPTNPLYIN